MKKSFYLGTGIIILAIILLLIKYYSENSRFQVKTMIVNNSKKLTENQAEKIVGNIIYMYNDAYKKVLSMDNYQFEFNDSTDNEYIVAIVTYEWKVIMPPEKRPIVIGLNKAYNELKEDKRITDKESKYLQEYIDGWIVEFDSYYNKTMTFTKDDVPDEIFIKINKNDDISFKLFHKGYHKPNGEYIEEFILLKEYFNTIKLTDENVKQEEKDGYNRLYEELKNYRCQGKEVVNNSNPLTFFKLT